MIGSKQIGCHVNKILPFNLDGEWIEPSHPAPARISQYAVVDPKAEIGPEVEIGPFCVIGPDVKVGRGTVLQNNVTLVGRTTLGKNNRIFPNVVIGCEPQDLSYKGADTQVIVGDGNLIRENVTINRASEKEEGITRLGSGCFIMASCHIAHDCKIGDSVVMANNVLLGGHVHIHSNVTLAGGVGVHHFGSVGRFCFVGAMSRVTQDVAPFMLADGNPARALCVNVVALKRKNIANPVIRALNEAFRLLYRSRVGLENAREILTKDELICEEVLEVLEFVEFSQNGRHGRGRDRRRGVA